MFTPARREKSKLRLALTGPSGAGKTLSALYLAYGLTNDWGRVALIDTERNRAKLYANRTDLMVGQFLHADFVPPYAPERYISFVKDGAGLVGADGVVIVDSLSHGWSSEGGILEIKDKISLQHGKNSYTAWGEAGKLQNAMINTILSVNCHIIVTMRSKMDYAQEKTAEGKTVIKKLGLSPIQRDDAEYEFDTVMDLGRDHVATTSKDTTFLDGFVDIITPDLGSQLLEWLNDGDEPACCEDCLQRIRSTKSNTVQEIAEKTLAVTGKTLCIACSKKWKELQGGL